VQETVAGARRLEFVLLKDARRVLGGYGVEERTELLVNGSRDGVVLCSVPADS
jgi:hypothetical protein